MPVLPSWRELVVATVPGSPRAHPAGQRWSTCPAATNASKWSRTRSVNRPASTCHVAAQQLPKSRPRRSIGHGSQGW